MLRQSIRDMQEEVESAARRIAHLSETQQAMDKRRAALESVLADIEEQLDLCFESGNQALARKTVRRKLETERSARALAARYEDGEQQLDAERESHSDNLRSLEGLRQKAELFVDAGHGASSIVSEGPVERTGAAVSDDEVEIAFLREQSVRGAS